MNWMANSKSRIQKRKSTSANRQREFFAKKDALSCIKSHNEMKELRASTLFHQEAAFSVLAPESINKIRLSNRGRSRKEIGCTPCITSEAAGSVLASEQEDCVLLPRKVVKFSEDKRPVNVIELAECRYHLRSEIDRLQEIIYEQQNRIKQLEERLLNYENPLYTGQNFFSGSRPSFLGPVEQIPKITVCKHTGGTPGNRNQENSNPSLFSTLQCSRQLEPNVEARFTINICTGSVACNSNRGFNFLEDQCGNNEATRNCFLLHYALKNRLYDSDSKALNTVIQQSVLNGQGDMPLLNQQLLSPPRIELIEK